MILSEDATTTVGSDRGGAVGAGRFCARAVSVRRGAERGVVVVLPRMRGAPTIASAACDGPDVGRLGIVGIGVAAAAEDPPAGVDSAGRAVGAEEPWARRSGCRDVLFQIQIRAAAARMIAAAPKR